MAIIKARKGTIGVILAVIVLIGSILTLVGKPEYALLINQNLGTIEEGVAYIIEEDGVTVVSGSQVTSSTGAQ